MFVGAVIGDFKSFLICWRRYSSIFGLRPTLKYRWGGAWLELCSCTSWYWGGFAFWITCWLAKFAICEVWFTGEIETGRCWKLLMSICCGCCIWTGWLEASTKRWFELIYVGGWAGWGCLWMRIKRWPLWKNCWFWACKNCWFWTCGCWLICGRCWGVVASCPCWSGGDWKLCWAGGDWRLWAIPRRAAQIESDCKFC